jgi:hypothetical protein
MGKRDGENKSLKNPSIIDSSRLLVIRRQYAVFFVKIISININVISTLMLTYINNILPPPFTFSLGRL